MKHIVYYMPRILSNNNSEYHKDFLKLVGKNASAIDRTNNFKLPFNSHIIWDIPTSINDSYTENMFNDEMLTRARDLLLQNLPIIIFYSGGLDSTGMLIAFDYIIKNENFNKELITIATSIDAMYENPDCWWNIVIKYNIINVHNCLNNIDNIQTLYVMGENADQLFGSDKIFQLPNISSMLLTGEYSECNLNTYLTTLNINQSPLFLDSLHGLINCSPIKIDYMHELLWWINFSCKWQSVSLRTLCFTKLLLKTEVHPSTIKLFETFYNTNTFQQISMLKSFNRFSQHPSAESYKFALRLFIKEYCPLLTNYSNNKIKVGSLYNIVRHRNYEIQQIFWNSDTKNYTAE